MVAVDDHRLLVRDAHDDVGVENTWLERISAGQADTIEERLAGEWRIAADAGGCSHVGRELRLQAFDREIDLQLPLAVGGFIDVSPSTCPLQLVLADLIPHFGSDPEADNRE